MKEKSRVLLLSTAYLPHIGGSELAIKNITDRMQDLDFDLITTRLDDGLSEYEKIGNINVYRVGGFLSLSNLLLPKIFLPIHVFFMARKLIKKNEYKLVHVFQASGAGGAAWLLKLFGYNLPVILTMQEGKNLDQQGFLINFFRKMIILKSDHGTAISNYLGNYMVKINKNLSVEVIPNGVDIDNFSKEFSYGELSSLEGELGIQPDDKVIITTSRLVEKNGVDILVLGFKELLEEYRMPAKLIIVGDGPDKHKIKSLARAQGIESEIIFCNSVSNEEVPRYLKISDIFIRPSRSEGLGNSFLEAMAAGVPIIGTRVGGIPDFLEDRKTGLYCNLDPSDIAYKINILLENNKLREEIVKRAGQLVRGSYDWNFITDKYRNLYNKVS